MKELNPIISDFHKEREVNAFSYQILETRDFYVDLLSEINHATDRIWIQTMAFEHCHFTDLLVRSLIVASRKGVDVCFVSDAYSDYVTDNTFNHLPLLSKASRSYKKIVLDNSVSLFEELGTSNITMKKTNVPIGLYRYTPLPGVMGRDHKKVVIVDNQAYIGGVNMTALDAKRIDFMFKTDNISVVKALMELFYETLNDLPQSDRVIDCDGNNLLLIDGGKPMRSIIMENTYDLINREQEQIILISPFFPSGKLGERLNAAVKRGVTVNFITSSRESLSGFTPKLSQFVHNLGQKKKLFSTFYASDLLHAKAIITSGNQRAILGSHNFDELFVTLGTEEVSLLTAEPEVINQLIDLANRLKSQ